MKMFKRLCLVLALAAGSVPAFAQFTTGGSKMGSGISAGDDYTLKPGYKGFVDLGYGIGVGDYGEGRLEVQTTHGYQFNPYFFAGVGAGFSYFHEGSLSCLPIFADLRGNLPITGSKISPFLDLKIGYSVLDVEGFYMSPSVGARIAVGQLTGLNISLGYEMQKWSYEIYIPGYWSEEGTENTGAFTIKLGLDF